MVFVSNRLRTSDLTYPMTRGKRFCAGVLMLLIFFVCVSGNILPAGRSFHKIYSFLVHANQGRLELHLARMGDCESCLGPMIAEFDSLGHA